MRWYLQPVIVVSCRLYRSAETDTIRCRNDYQYIYMYIGLYIIDNDRHTPSVLYTNYIDSSGQKLMMAVQSNYENSLSAYSPVRMHIVYY